VVGLLSSTSTGFGCASLSLLSAAFEAGEGDVNVGVTLNQDKIGVETSYYLL
jgi:hypothetical protein